METYALSSNNGLPEVATKDRKGLWIFGESESKRRVILIEKKNGSYGFTLQSYGVRYKHGFKETDFITYVNAVEIGGPAYNSGLREGDVILSINGQNMARVEHKLLVNFIRNCPTHLKMVVVSDERARKVELNMRYVHLQKKLHDKMKELDELNFKEKELLAKICTATTTTTNPTSNRTNYSNSNNNNNINSCPKSKDGSTCLPNDSSTCCFCPIKQKHHSLPNTNTQCIGIGGNSASAGNNAEKEVSTIKQKSSYSSVSKPSSSSSSSATPKSPNDKDSKGGKSQSQTEAAFYYRKSQSSRELTINDGRASSSDPSTSTKVIDDPNSSSSLSNREFATSSMKISKQTLANTQFNSLHHHYSTSSSKNPHSSTGPPSNSKEKPKSWDNLIAFGGYAFGYGYGYFPRVTPQDEYATHGHHPHHHNHHRNFLNRSHNKPPNSSGVGVGDILLGATGGGISGGSGTLPAKTTNYYSGISNLTPTNTSILCQSQSQGGKIIEQSKTLPPSLKSPNFITASDNFSVSSRMEKTLSDSSLNSETHKDFPKTMAFYNNSGGNKNNSSDNIRYASDEDFDQYSSSGEGKGGNNSSGGGGGGKGKFDICV